MSLGHLPEKERDKFIVLYKFPARLKKFLFLTFGFLLTFTFTEGQIISKYLPLDNAVIGSSDVFFSWKKRPGVTVYTLEVSADAAFSSPQQFMTTAGAYSLNGVATGAYWWRVRGDSGPWSSVGQFRVIHIGSDVVPKIWLKADEGVTLTSGLVSGWQNTMGTALTQSDFSKQPSLDENGLAGLPTVRFGKQGAAGDLTFLNISPAVSLPGGENTLLEVLRLNYNPAVVQYFLSGNGNGFYPGGPGLGPGVFDGTDFRYATAGPLVDWQLISYRKNEIRRNGGAPMAATGPGISHSFSLTQLGKRADQTSLFFSGNLSELLLFDYQVNDSILSLLSQYLMSKYTRPVRFPYDTLVCAESLQLSVPGGGADYASVLWSTGQTTASVSITANGTYWARATSKFGITTTDTIRVNGVFPKPGISPSAPQFFCFGRDSITVRNISAVVPGIVYTWQDGSSGDSIRVTSERKIFLAAFDPASGCTVTSDTTFLTHKIRADFANPAACPGKPASFHDLSVDLTGDTVTTWYWNFGDPTSTTDVSTDTNGVWTYARSGTYPVYLRVTASDGCADSTSKNVIIKPSAVPLFNWQGLCYGKPTQFFDRSTPEPGTQVTGYQWTFRPGVTSSFVNPATVFDTAGIYPVSLTIYTASGCNETVLLPVPVNKGVNAAFDVSDSLCARHAVDIADQSQGVNDNIVSWLWRFGSNTPVSGQAPVFSFQGTGSRIVRLTVTTAAGCTDSVQKTVFVRPAPTAAFSFVQNGGTPPFTPQVINQSTDADHVRWNFGSGFTETAYTPVLPAFPDTGTYTVRLAVRNDEGCTDTVSKKFVVFTGDRTLQLMNATCTAEDGFVTYSARVLNKGGLEVNRITFGANLDYNSVLKENWEGSLLPGQVIDYTFKSAAKYFTDANFCCVRIDRFNDSLSVNPPDNEICLPLSSTAWFSTAYPTPTDGQVTIDYTLPFADKLSAALHSVDGKTIRTLFTNQAVSAGFGSLMADVADLRAGVYVIRFYYREKNYPVKLIKR